MPVVVLGIGLTCPTCLFKSTVMVEHIVWTGVGRLLGQQLWGGQVHPAFDDQHWLPTKATGSPFEEELSGM